MGCAGRLVREGKAAIAGDAAEILRWPGSSVEGWQARVEKLSRGRMFGWFFAASRARLREVAERLGLRRLAKLNACPTGLTGPGSGALVTFVGRPT